MPSIARKRNSLRSHGEIEEELWLKNKALAAVHECVAIADASLPELPLIYVNDAFEHVTGYSNAEAVGRPCCLLQGAASDPLAKEKLRIAIQERRECSVELLNYRKDGKTFLSRIALMPVENDGGRISHLIMIQSDVTEQKRMEDALDAAAKALQTTFMDIQNITEATRALQTVLPVTSHGEFRRARFALDILRCPDLSGDLASCFTLNNQYIGVYVADLRTRGIPTALNSLMLSQLLCAGAGQSLLYRPMSRTSNEYEICEPVEVMERVRIDPRMAREVIGSLSLAYGVLDSGKHELRYTAVGQIGMILMPAAGEPTLLGPAEFPEYFYPETFCEQKVAKMNAGDRVYLCTDGLTDALNQAGERLGMEGLLKAIEQSSCQSLGESVASIASLARHWCGTAGIEDDASVLGIEVFD